METYEKLGISQSLLEQIIAVISSCASVERAVVFGSRATGNFKKNSDIDLAIYSAGISQTE